MAGIERVDDGYGTTTYIDPEKAARSVRHIDEMMGPGAADAFMASVRQWVEEVGSSNQLTVVQPEI